MPFDGSRFDKNTPIEQLASVVFDALNSLEVQLNAKPELHVNTKDHFPAGTKPGQDFLATIATDEDKMRLSIPLSKKTKRDFKIEDLGGPYQTPQPLHFLGMTSSAASPSLTEYPLDQDWGFHTDTTGPTYYLVLNVAGVLQITPFNPDPFLNTNFLGVQTAAGLPTVAQFPNNQDWGFWRDSSGAVPNLYLVYNRSAVIEFAPFEPFGNTQYLAQKSGVGIAPATVLAAFPTAGDFGFYLNTSTSRIYFVKNVGGATIFKVELT